MRNIAAVAALVPLIAVVAFLRETPDEPSDPAAVRVDPVTTPDPPLPSANPPQAASTNPTNRAAASLGVTDIRALETFNAKRDAKAFAHSYNIAVRLGVTQLAAISSPRTALAMLVQGVPGQGEMVHSFRDLNAREIEAAASLVAYQNGKMVALPEAEFTELEEEIKKRALSCKYGACTDCIADVRSTNRLKQAREATAVNTPSPPSS